MTQTIFLIEDEKSLSETLSRFLRDKGYSVETAYSGVEAAEKLPLIKPDIILLDIVLPEKSGIDFLKEAQKEGSEYAKIPVIVLTNLQGNEESFQKFFLNRSKNLHSLEPSVKSTFPGFFYRFFQPPYSVF